MKTLLYALFLAACLPYSAAAQSPARSQRLTATIFWIWPAGSSAPPHDTISYTYSGGRGGTPDGIILFDTCTLMMGPPPGGRDNLLRTINAYDSGNRVTSVILQDWAATYWQNHLHLFYTYNTAGNTTQQLTQAWDNTASVWRDSCLDSSDYRTGRCMGTYRSLWDDFSGTWNPSERWLYTYDASGRNDTILHQYGYTHLLDDSRTNFTYTGTGKLASQTLEKYTSGSWERQSRTLYSYDTADRKSGILQQEWSGSSWDNRSDSLVEYNAAGRVCRQYLRNWTAPLTTDTTFQLETVFNSDGQPSRLTFYTLPYPRDSAVRYYFYEDYIPGDPTPTAIPALAAAAGELLLYPVPARQQLQLQFNQVAARAATATVYDLQGRERMHWSIPSIGSYRETIDISTLTPGTYILCVRTPGATAVTRSFSVIH